MAGLGTEVAGNYFKTQGDDGKATRVFSTELWLFQAKTLKTT